jgi:anion-transporting  ArsA/GET3 family ATPase
MKRFVTLLAGIVCSTANASMEGEYSGFSINEDGIEEKALNKENEGSSLLREENLSLQQKCNSKLDEKESPRKENLSLMEEISPLTEETISLIDDISRIAKENLRLKEEVCYIAEEDRNLQRKYDHELEEKNISVQLEKNRHLQQEYNSKLEEIERLAEGSPSLEEVVRRLKAKASDLLNKSSTE